MHQPRLPFARPAARTATPQAPEASASPSSATRPSTPPTAPRPVGASALQPWRPELRGAELALHDTFLSPAEAASLFSQLLDSPHWEQDTLQLFGQRRLVPRLHQWFASDGQVYRWSGLTMRPQPFPPCVERVRAAIEAAGGAHFNSALANLYRGGKDSVAWHADDEPELGARPIIASLSLGAPRRFSIRLKAAPRERLDLTLPSGSLLLMSGETQRVCEHCVPKTRKPIGPRINLTFRAIQDID